MKGELLSSIELVLPPNVVEACYRLRRDGKAGFRAVNKEEGTSSEITLHRQEDNSVKIHIAVVSLAGEEEEATTSENPGTSTQPPQPPPPSRGRGGRRGRRGRGGRQTGRTALNLGGSAVAETVNEPSPSTSQQADEQHGSNVDSSAPDTGSMPREETTDTQGSNVVPRKRRRGREVSPLREIPSTSEEEPTFKVPRQPKALKTQASPGRRPGRPSKASQQKAHKSPEPEPTSPRLRALRNKMSPPSPTKESSPKQTVNKQDNTEGTVSEESHGNDQDIKDKSSPVSKVSMKKDDLVRVDSQQGYKPRSPRGRGRGRGRGKYFRHRGRFASREVLSEEKPVNPAKEAGEGSEGVNDKGEKVAEDPYSSADVQPSEGELTVDTEMENEMDSQASCHLVEGASLIEEINAAVSVAKSKKNKPRLAKIWGSSGRKRRRGHRSAHVSTPALSEPLAGPEGSQGEESPSKESQEEEEEEEEEEVTEKVQEVPSSAPPPQMERTRELPEPIHSPSPPPMKEEEENKSQSQIPDAGNSQNVQHPDGHPVQESGMEGREHIPREGEQLEYNGEEMPPERDILAEAVNVLKGSLHEDFEIHDDGTTVFNAGLLDLNRQQVNTCTLDAYHQTPAPGQGNHMALPVLDSKNMPLGSTEVQFSHAGDLLDDKQQNVLESFAALAVQTIENNREEDFRTLVYDGSMIQPHTTPVPSDKPVVDMGQPGVANSMGAGAGQNLTDGNAEGAADAPATNEDGELKPLVIDSQGEEGSPCEVNFNITIPQGYPGDGQSAQPPDTLPMDHELKLPQKKRHTVKLARARKMLKEITGEDIDLDEPMATDPDPPTQEEHQPTKVIVLANGDDYSHIDQPPDQPTQVIQIRQRTMAQRGSKGPREEIKLPMVVGPDGELTAQRNSTEVIRELVKIATVQQGVEESADDKKKREYKREFRVQCRFCPVKVKDYGYLFRHIKKLHSKEPTQEAYLNEIRPLMRTPCPVCNKLVSSISNISSHMKQCHPERDSSVICPLCLKTYKTPVSLRQHLRQCHHPQQKMFTCEICDLTFTENRSLKEHINCTHETTQVFHCDICGKSFLTKGRLRRHKYIHGEYRHFCKHCGKGFHLKDNMNKHIEIMHEKTRGKRFQCQYCQKRFTVKGNMTQHVMGVHLKVFQYKCNPCDLGFRRKKDFLNHIAKHQQPIDEATDRALQQSLDMNGEELTTLQTHHPPPVQQTPVTIAPATTATPVSATSPTTTQHTTTHELTTVTTPLTTTPVTSATENVVHHGSAQSAEDDEYIL